MSDATWHLFSHTNMHKHAKGEAGWTRVRNLSPEGFRKEEIRAGERMAPTAWHLNRGFPLSTLSSLRFFCFHKENLFHMAPSASTFSNGFNYYSWYWLPQYFFDVAKVFLTRWSQTLVTALACRHKHIRTWRTAAWTLFSKLLSH